MAQIKLTQKPGEEVPIEVLAKSIVEISRGLREVRAGRLNDRALILLLQNASGVNQAEIKRVLWGLENLAALYVKKPAASK